MALGHKNGDDGSVEVILPTGNICPKSVHGIPDFDGADKTPGFPGIAEAQGVIYMCGGTLQSVQTSKPC